MTNNLNIRNNWTFDELKTIYNQPFNDLLWQSHQFHRKYHNPNKIQISTLMSIKTGGCPEDCKYCSQSIRYQTEIELEKTLPVSEVIKQAREAKKQGASRFCMGAAWRNLSDTNLTRITEMITDGLHGLKPLKAMNNDRFLIPLLNHETAELEKQQINTP